MAAAAIKAPAAARPIPPDMPARLPWRAIKAAIGAVPMATPIVAVAAGSPASEADPSRSSAIRDPTVMVAMNPVRANPVRQRARQSVDVGLMAGPAAPPKCTGGQAGSASVPGPCGHGPTRTRPVWTRGAQPANLVPLDGKAEGNVVADLHNGRVDLPAGTSASQLFIRFVRRRRRVPDDLTGAALPIPRTTSGRTMPMPFHGSRPPGSPRRGDRHCEIPRQKVPLVCMGGWR